MTLYSVRGVRGVDQLRQAPTIKSNQNAAIYILCLSYLDRSPRSNIRIEIIPVQIYLRRNKNMPYPFYPETIDRHACIDRKWRSKEDI